MNMDIQRLRNLTTGRLHTKMEHIYQDIEYLTGVPGIMTHQIPNAFAAIEPWLREKVHHTRFWNGEHDLYHIGEYELQPMTEPERTAMLERFGKLPSPLAGKKVIVVKAPNERS